MKSIISQLRLSLIVALLNICNIDTCISLPLIYPYQRHVPSDEGLTLETSAFESLYSGQFTLSTQLIKPNYLRKCKLKIEQFTDVCMTAGMMYTPSHTNVCNFFNFQLAFSQLILNLKCWNLASPYLVKQRCSF